ncbi:MAG: dTDP-glucose 4,6-dehydratase [Deltaproteobacteria bacterium]|nr:dTDP-glucose 4,6-dehydratase [Deltaproteobacteria bacterium]
MKIQNLLVTGGCGFIGSNFIHYIFRQPDFEGRIINIDALTYAGNPFNVATVKDAYGERYHFRRIDICDFPSLESVFADFEIDAVCHFAAESHVDRSIKRPDAFVNTNIIGTFNLLECARSKGEEFLLFHHISTDEVYGSLGPDGAFTEETPYRPNSPYSASKASSDHLVRSYNRTFGLPTTLSNCSNNYGPYQFPEKLIPLMILNALEYQSLPVYGDGKNVRDWLYVEDHCEAILTIMKQGRRGETYNVGGATELENIAIVENICDLVDEYAGRRAGKAARRHLITYVADRPGHDRRYAIDFSKLTTELDWIPRETFSSGLRKTVSWYLEHRNWVADVRTKDYQRWIEQQYGRMP